MSALRQIGMSVLLLAVLCHGAWAQSGATGEYRAYPLKYKAAADAERVLSPMLEGMGDSTRLVVDSGANQVLLRGPRRPTRSCAN